MSIADIRVLLARIPVFAGADELRVQPLSRETTNQIYRVESLNGCWALRVTSPGVFVVDRNREARIVDQVGRAGLGPRLVYSDPKTGTLVTEWLEGRPWTRADLHVHRNLERLAARLAELHRLPWDGKKEEPAELARPYIDHLVTKQPELAKMLRELIAKRIGQLEQRTVALCHRDLLHDNLIDAGTLMLIDWEYAGGGEPLFDLATVICYHDLKEDERGVLLEAYDKFGGKVDRARLDRYCAVVDILTVAWAHCSPRSRRGFERAQGLARAARCRLQL